MRNNQKIENDNIMDSFKNATNGLMYAVKTQLNIKIQLVIAIIAIILSIVLKINIIELLFIIVAVFLVIFAEMINTAIETVVDLCVETYHIKAKIAKDVAAGAVLILSINSIVMAGFIFIKEIIQVF